jgi:hypothetical protein
MSWRTVTISHLVMVVLLTTTLATFIRIRNYTSIWGENPPNILSKTRPGPAVKSAKNSSQATKTEENHAVIITFNSKFELCAEKLLRSIRREGKWTGTIVAITQKHYVPSEELSNLMKELMVETLQVEPFTDITYHGSSDAFNKFHIFIEPKFRRFSVLMYLDVDGFVNAPLDPLASALRDSQQTLLMRDNGNGIGKPDLYVSEYRDASLIRNVTRNTKNPGSTCMFLVNTTRLPEPSKLKQILQKAVLNHGKNCKFADQSLLHIVFRESMAVMAPCVPIKVVYPDEDAGGGWYYRSCPNGNSTEIYHHDIQKKCLRKT